MARKHGYTCKASAFTGKAQTRICNAPAAGIVYDVWLEPPYDLYVCSACAAKYSGKTYVPIDDAGETMPHLRRVIGAVAVALLALVQGCAEWPMYYYRNTPGGQVVVPAQGAQPCHARPAYTPMRGRR